MARKRAVIIDAGLKAFWMQATRRLRLRDAPHLVLEIGQRALRSIGTMGGERPTRMTPNPSKPNR